MSKKETCKRCESILNYYQDTQVLYAEVMDLMAKYRTPILLIDLRDKLLKIKEIMEE